MIQNYLKKNWIFLTEIIFFICIFFIKIPPFYLIPIQSRFFVSHTFAKIGIFFIFLIYPFTRNLGKNKIIIYLLGSYFLTQSLSVIATKDISLFLKSYQNVLANICIFALSYSFITNNSKKHFSILNTFIITVAIICALIEFIFYLLSDSQLQLLSFIIQRETFDAYMTDLERGRLFLLLNFEMFISLFIFIIAQEKNINKKIIYILSLGILLFLSFTSNVRSRIIMSITSISLTFFFFLKTTPHYLFLKRIGIGIIWLFMFFIIFTISIKISNLKYSLNILDRITLQNEREDIDTIDFRIKSIDTSLELFKTSPLIGVGLGNYFDSRNTVLSHYLPSQKHLENYYLAVAYNPHNIFLQIVSETGILGLLSFCLLLLYFVIQDVRAFRTKQYSRYTIAYMIGSWTIISYSFFNPATTIFISGWFWFLRGIIQGYNDYLLTVS